MKKVCRMYTFYNYMSPVYYVKDRVSKKNKFIIHYTRRRKTENIISP